MKRALLLLALSLCPVYSFAAFTNYTAFTVQTGQVPSTQTNFAVLLKPTDNRFRTVGNGGHVQNASGYDIRPYSDSGCSSALVFQFITNTYDATTGTFEMWVKVASLADGSVIYLCYGDSSLSSDGSGVPFDTNFKAIYHQNDNAANTTIIDSMGSYNLTAAANTSTKTTTGKIDGGLTWNGSSDEASNTSVSAVGNTYTISGWFNTNSTSTDQGIFEHTFGTANNGYAVYLNSPTLTLFYGGLAAYNFASLPAISTSTWYYFAISSTGAEGTGTGYLGSSGALSNQSQAIGTPTFTPDSFYMGTLKAFNLRFDGSLDEIRISNVVRSTNWLTTEFNNQKAPGSFYSIGAEQSAGGGTCRGALSMMGLGGC